MSIGENIARLRKEKGLTQAELGEKLRITNQAVSKWESGMTMPDIMLLPEIAKIFDVAIEELYSNDINISKKTITNKKALIENDNRILVISVENKDAMVKTRIPVKTIEALLTNKEIKDNIGVTEEESNLFYDMLSSSSGDIVDVCKDNMNTRITIEDYEA